jgi:hypothetical protein
MKTKEPPYTEPYVRWCGRSVDKIIIYLLPDSQKFQSENFKLNIMNKKFYVIKINWKYLNSGHKKYRGPWYRLIKLGNKLKIGNFFAWE